MITLQSLTADKVKPTNKIQLVHPGQCSHTCVFETVVFNFKSLILVCCDHVLQMQYLDFHSCGCVMCFLVFVWPRAALQCIHTGIREQ